MNIETYFRSIENLVDTGNIETAIAELKRFLQKSPQLDELIIHSARYNDVVKQIRLGVIDHENAKITKNEIRVAILSLLREIENIYSCNIDMKNKIEKQDEPNIFKPNTQSNHVQNNKNTIIGGNIIVHGDFRLGDDIYPPPEKEKTADDYYSEGISFLEKDPPEYDQAFTSFTYAINKETNHVKAYVHRGIIRMNQNDFHAAIRNFKDAIYLTPLITSEHCDAIFHLASSFVMLGDFERASNWLEKAREQGCNVKNPQIDNLFNDLSSMEKL